MSKPLACAPIINDYRELTDRLRVERQGKRLICTIGSWDLLHSGHIEYLKRAREFGDILVVGVDSDLAYQRYKGKPNIYPQGDRQEIVSTVRYVDYVTVVDDVNIAGEWQMGIVTAIQPDVFVCNETSYSVKQRKKLANLCKIQRLPFYVPASTTSSAAVSQEIKSMFLAEQESRLQMRIVAFFVVIAMFALSILTSLTMVVMDAFGIVKLQTGVFYTLILKSTPELLAMTYLVIKYLFSGGEHSSTESRRNRNEDNPNVAKT